MDRRSFLAGTGLLTLSAIGPALSHGGQFALPERKVRLTIVTDGPARVEVRVSRGEMYHPEGAVMDHTAVNAAKKEASTGIGSSSPLSYVGCETLAFRVLSKALGAYP
jgi:hypothetical protein